MNASEPISAGFLRLAATLCVAAALCGAPARAQTGSAPPPAVVRLTVDDAVSRAAAASHRVAEGVARADAAGAVVAARRAADNPVVSVLAGYMRTNHVDEFGIAVPGQAPRIIYPDVPDNLRGRLDVAWPIYTAGRVQALERAATAETNAAEKDVDAIRADVRFDATRAFWVFVMARDAVRVVEESLERVTAHLADVKVMRDAGLLAPNDVLSVEARRSRERVLLVEARNARDVAEADLRRATGLSPGTGIEPEVTPLGPASGVGDTAALVAAARMQRTDRQALEQRIHAIGERRAAAAAAQRPVVSLVGGADYARPNPRIFPRAAAWNTSFDIGINVAWSAWDGGRAGAEMAEADAGRRAAEERLAEFDRQLEFDVTQRRLDIEAARASLGAAQDGLAAAREAHRVVAERFKAGLVSNGDVIDAEVALAQAQLDVTRATTAIRLAEARLSRTLGR